MTPELICFLKSHSHKPPPVRSYSAVGSRHRRGLGGAWGGGGRGHHGNGQDPVREEPDAADHWGDHREGVQQPPARYAAASSHFGSAHSSLEALIGCGAWSVLGTVERVKKIRDYAFVHFTQREHAIHAMKTLNGKVVLIVVVATLLDATFSC